jgi:MoxR-like ATPase
MHFNPSLIEQVAAMLEPWRDDEEAFLDTLDGETDCLSFIDAQIDAMQQDAALAAATEARAADIAARAARIEHRSEARRGVILSVMKAMGVQKLERPLATVSVRPGSVSVHIENDDDIPTQLKRVKTTVSPDKTAIRKILDAGETVPGACLVTGDETLSVRVK